MSEVLSRPRPTPPVAGHRPLDHRTPDRRTPDRRTCLVVDDSRVVRCVAGSILRSAGFAVQEAENGLLALHSCRAQMPDCVLLDWAMPVMGGLPFLQALRAEFGPHYPPVVFCTTENDLLHIERAIAGGAQEYIMKPFDEEILLSKLRLVGLA